MTKTLQLAIPCRRALLSDFDVFVLFQGASRIPVSGEKDSPIRAHVSELLAVLGPKIESVSAAISAFEQIPLTEWKRRKEAATTAGLPHHDIVVSERAWGVLTDIASKSQTQGCNAGLMDLLHEHLSAAEKIEPAEE